ncbi:helix-turn-helix domain-containing protein [Arenicella xantha]|uniref:AraC-like DNA-binding protein n=1 Tax=Arenicella xantha TaxID=644221 RepID=A0A395JKY0_9GAMM|nr:helix-turn-helix domain-containing protein [Arenicella xantha]RBP51085.1 AraC-like DNA-binding protein [Arenicella xantha]
MRTNSQYTHYRIDVPDEFSAVFSHFYFAQNNSEKTIRRTLLPSFQTILIFSFKARTILGSQTSGQISVDKCLILGPIKQAFDYALPANSEILVANFKDDAFFRFFGLVAIQENRQTSPDELLSDNCFTALWHDLNRIDSAYNRVDFILEFCRPYLKTRNELAAQLVHAKGQSPEPINTVAHSSNKSQRTIQTHFKRYFGYTAKQVNRYQRFLKAIELVHHLNDQDKCIDWFDVLSECGYYDQSHLIHDFKHYLNLSPSQYLKFQQTICNPVS